MRENENNENGNTGWCEQQSERIKWEIRSKKKKSNKIKKEERASDRILYVSERFVEVSWGVRSK